MRSTSSQTIQWDENGRIIPGTEPYQLSGEQRAFQNWLSGRQYPKTLPDGRVEYYYLPPK